MEQKIKVVHLITRLELGGAQGNTIYTVEHLDSTRYQTQLWFGPGGFWDEEVSDRFPQERIKIFPHLVRSLHPWYDFLVVRDLVTALKKERPDVLHTHSSKAGIVGRLAARLAGVPVVIHTFHGFGFNREQKPWTRALFIFLEKLVARWTTALVFVSQANWDEATLLGIGSSDRYHRIRSGIPLAQYKVNQSSDVRIKAREKWNFSKESVLLTVGPFKPQKNLIDFILVVSRLKPRHPHLKALIVGDGEQRPLLENEITRLNLTDSVTLLGWRKDVPELMALADVFVMSSLWEGLPRALAEALASGTPAVCYDTDGVHDLLSKGGGILVPPKDVEQLAEQIGALLINKDQAKKLSSEGPRIVEKEFDIDQMVQDQESLYNRLLAKQ